MINFICLRNCRLIDLFKEVLVLFGFNMLCRIKLRQNLHSIVVEILVCWSEFTSNRLDNFLSDIATEEGR